MLLLLLLLLLRGLAWAAGLRRALALHVHEAAWQRALPAGLLPHLQLLELLL